MRNVAQSCECDRPMPNGLDCSKCGKPLSPPVVRLKPPTQNELLRRRKIAEYWRGRSKPRPTR